MASTARNTRRKFPPRILRSDALHDVVDLIDIVVQRRPSSYLEAALEHVSRME